MVCQDLAHREKQRSEAARQRKLDEALKGIKLGKRYDGKTFDDFEPVCMEAKKIKERCQKYVDGFTDRLENCDNLLFLGNPGTGKNLLAAAVCNAVIQNGFTAVHTTAMKLVRRIRSTWGDRKENEQAVIESFCIPDLLVIDEIGVQFGSRAEELQLTEVINERYEQMRPTILLSNLDIKGVEKYLGPRVIDRFYEGHSAVFEFTWQSYRRGSQFPKAV